MYLFTNVSYFKSLISGKVTIQSVVDKLVTEANGHVIEKIQASLKALEETIHDKFLMSHLKESFNNVQNYLLTSLTILKEAFSKFQ